MFSGKCCVRSLLFRLIRIVVQLSSVQLSAANAKRNWEKTVQNQMLTCVHTECIILVYVFCMLYMSIIMVCCIDYKVRQWQKTPSKIS